MDFLEEIKAFTNQIEARINVCQTEEATKMSLIVPFFQILGYDVFNPTEFCPEFTADVGIKKGEKVDYAIMENGSPVVLIECKWCGEKLDKYGSQLFRYFSTTTAKFGILTNGVSYKFYTDLEEANKMDLVPFLEIDFKNIKENQLAELKKFCKSNFDSDRIFSTAEELKYSSLIKQLLTKELDNPSESFIKYILNNIYDGVKTQKTLEKFSPIIKKSFTAFVNEIVNQKISSALTTESDVKEEITEEVEDEVIESKIITTQEELDAFYIIRAILSEFVPADDIIYKDTERYFGIFYKNLRQTLCRVYLNSKNKALMIPDKDKVYTKYELRDVSDIFKHKEQLIGSLNLYKSDND